jgi:hypothetical protein
MAAAKPDPSRKGLDLDQRQMILTAGRPGCIRCREGRRAEQGYDEHHGE